MSARSWIASFAVLSLVACSPAPDKPEPGEATGPPKVQEDVVLAHARQLDDELGPRAAGSQEEQIASQYVLGHLQRAGYLVRLDAVPVGNLVESSNLLALPPTGDNPEIIVTAPYDSPPGEVGGGEAVGLLLELARALNVVSPGHEVEFAALGADSGGSEDKRLGSRRLARELVDQGLRPTVIELGRVGANVPMEGRGGLAEVLTGREASGAISSDVFADAGISATEVSGDPARLGEKLLGYLKQAGAPRH